MDQWYRASRRNWVSVLSLFWQWKRCWREKPTMNGGTFVAFPETGRGQQRWTDCTSTPFLLQHQLNGPYYLFILCIWHFPGIFWGKTNLICLLNQQSTNPAFFSYKVSNSFKLVMFFLHCGSTSSVPRSTFLNQQGEYEFHNASSGQGSPFSQSNQIYWPFFF